MSAARTLFRGQAKLYLPLAVHPAATLGIGYFIVIPQSCIAGINELTIGFGAANFGFLLTYLGGIHIARKFGGPNA